MPGEREEKVSLELTDEVLKSMEVGLVFRDYNGRISSMDFHRSEKFMVTASDDESIRLYDFQNAMWLKTINSKKYGVDLVSFTDHPTTVIYSSKNGWDESLRLLSLNDNKYLRYFKGHHDRVVSLSWCPWKDYFISGSLDRTVLLWDQRAEKSQGLLRVQGRPAVSYDDQGMVFAIAFGGYIRMFDTRMYEKGPFENFSVGGDFSEANVVKFSNDGRKMLLTTMGGHIHVLDSFRGTMISTFTVKPVSSNATLEASFSPDGAFVVSGYKRPFAALFFGLRGYLMVIALYAKSSTKERYRDLTWTQATKRIHRNKPAYTGTNFSLEKPTMGLRLGTSLKGVLAMVVFMAAMSLVEHLLIWVKLIRRRHRSSGLQEVSCLPPDHLNCHFGFQTYLSWGLLVA